MRRNAKRRRREVHPADYIGGVPVAGAVALSRVGSVFAGRPFSAKEFTEVTGMPPTLLRQLGKDGVVERCAHQYMFTEFGRAVVASAISLLRVADPVRRNYGGPRQYPYGEEEEDTPWEFGPPRRWGRW
mgnify:FL=1